MYKNVNSYLRNREMKSNLHVLNIETNIYWLLQYPTYLKYLCLFSGSTFNKFNDPTPTIVIGHRVFLISYSKYNFLFDAHIKY
jgi:hypothetical protein